MNELHLFAGVGGGILGGHLLGHTCVCAVEIEPYCRKVLLQRQRDGILPHFPIWDDVRTFDGEPWCGLVDVVCGGFPCQDISCAGGGAGLAGERSGLWSEMARIVGEVRPRYVLVENSPMLTGRGLDRMLMDLAEMGYDAEWGVLGADDAGAPHHRKRIWILAYANGDRLQGKHTISSSKKINKEEWSYITRMVSEVQTGKMLYIPESWIIRNGKRTPEDVDQLKAIGNGQVPAVVEIAWKILYNRINEKL